MTPRHPPDRPDDDTPSALNPPAHDTPDDVTPENERPVRANKHDAAHGAEAEDRDDELDRIEAYLRGPTAFTA
jgi:hypothetical protein